MKSTQTFIATRKSFLNSLKCLGREGKRKKNVKGKGILHFKILEKGNSKRNVQIVPTILNES
jgi:hypothetical protein